MISVVIPTYNQAHVLPRAVESVWAQGVPDLEIIVVDDCSTDETQSVLDSLSQKGELRHLRLEQNSGPAAARNRGIRESRGEWVAFLDADDYWMPGKLCAQLRVLEEGAQTPLDFAYCGVVAVDKEGKVAAIYPAPPVEDFMDDLLWGNQIATPTMIVRRSLLEKTGLFDEALLVGEDWDLWLRIAAQARGEAVTEPLVTANYRANGYPLGKYESAVLRILPRIQEALKSRKNPTPSRSQQRQVLSWHFSVLAKSHFQERNILKSLRYVLRCLAHSPHGLRYLLPMRASRPQLKGLKPHA
ncbi:MAG TPA: glycosyltransferase [Pyrinomonadaceae bacterium]|nr:glycosyltransferase [Pyrinomonadaceae bacterium]